LIRDPGPRHAGTAEALARDLLPHVSRTFALTIPVLAEPLQRRVALSYLLCRILDTVEDAPGIGAGRRLELLALFRHLAVHPEDGTERARFQALWPGGVDAHHERLVREAGTLLDGLIALPHPARHAVSTCLEEMAVGMALFASSEGDERPRFVCPDLAALEAYCHVVAGTVGILLSHLFALELGSDWMTPERIEAGRRFGLGLQLTNVLKDRENDRQRGISYIPPDYLERTGDRWRLTPEGLRALIERALEHLDAAHQYVLALPASRDDLRVFCVWASHLALATLRLVAARGGGSVKVGREELGRILETTRAAAADDAALGALHRVGREAVRRALPD
jgi:farnesyl-diphosphate farnesyltransferase